MKRFQLLILTSTLLLMGTINLIAQNPIIKDQYTADPSARVFGNRVYLFPSHDILAKEGKGRVGWFCMEDYHVFSSENLVEWTDHGVIVTQNKVPWVKPNSYNMWAPDCIERNGKYYFYFPATPTDTITYGRGFAIGVAIADKPEGPYTLQNESIKKVKGIDPNVFIDKDGQAYLYWSAGNIYAAKLKDNMVELASDPIILKELPNQGLKEGPYLFERKGIYYLTYPHVENKIERLEYTMGNNPLGPFNNRGVIMDESASGCWTNHQSIIQFKDQWFLFYHNNDFSPQFDKNRSARIDSLFFNSDGTIKKVNPSFRGVGLIDAKKEIQIDRFSNISQTGLTVEFKDTSDRFKGWKTTFSEKGAWLQFNQVDFGEKNLKNVLVRALSTNGGTIQIRTKSINGPILTELKIEKSSDWKVYKTRLEKFEAGQQNLFIVSNGREKVTIDWIRFE